MGKHTANMGQCAGSSEKRQLDPHERSVTAWAATEIEQQDAKEVEKQQAAELALVITSRSRRTAEEAEQQRQTLAKMESAASQVPSMGVSEVRRSKRSKSVDVLAQVVRARKPFSTSCQQPLPEPVVVRSQNHGRNIAMHYRTPSIVIDCKVPVTPEELAAQESRQKLVLAAQKGQMFRHSQVKRLPDFSEVPALSAEAA